MKTCLATCACACLLVVSAGAIPQTFSQGPNLFSQKAGMSFEQFASEPAAWEGGDGLKGDWQAHGDTLTLKESATVFGVAADEITAIRKEGRVQSFRVVFRGKDKRANHLFGQVTANVKAFTGGDGMAASTGFIQYSYKNVIIRVSGAGDEVVVEFKRG